MILLIDGSNSISGGAIVYLSNLLRYLAPQKYEIEKIILYGYGKLLSYIEDKPWIKKIYESALDKGVLSRLRWLWFEFPKLVQNSDLVFFPAANYTKLSIPYISACRNILPFINFKELYGLSYLTLVNEYRRISQSKCFENSKGVIFLSEYAKNTVLKRLKASPRFIQIIPHGVSKRFSTPPKVQKQISEYTKEKPFRFLYVSGIAAYKYQWNVVKAFSILRNKKYFVTVDFIGPIYTKLAYRKFIGTIKKYDPSESFTNYLGFIPHNEIHKYYKNYDAFIFASIYETFGIPLIEAMASGLPVTSSDFELTHEILGDDAVYFDPKNPESIVEAVIKLIEDKELRERIAWNNFEKAKKYSWERCAHETFKFIYSVYKKL